MFRKAFLKRFATIKIQRLFLVVFGFVLLVGALFVLRLGDRKQKTTEITLSYKGGCIDVSSVFVNDEELFFAPSFTDKEDIEKIEENFARVVVSGGVPTIFIRTASGSMNEVYNDKEHEEPISIILIDENGNLTFENTEVKIKGRGNSTWYGKSKRPFRIKFEEETSLLEMGKTKDWILLANTYDHSCVRNAVAFDMASSIGMKNVSEYRFVDLYLNGEYNGLYMLIQPVDSFFEDGRSDIYLCATDLVERLSDSTNSFLIEPNIGIDVQLPNKLGKEDKEYVRDLIEETNRVIVDKQQSFEDVIDIDSWAKKYLLDELLCNYDSGVVSSFFFWYKTEQGDSPIYGGPIWDYDNCLCNQAAFYGTTINPQILFAANGERSESCGVLWYKCLYENPAFFEKAVRIYKNVARDEMINLANEGLKEKEKSIETAIASNKIRWGDKSDTISEVCDMEKWILDRIEFLDSIWLENNKYFCVTLEDGDYFRLFVREGETVSENEYFTTFIKDSEEKWIVKESGEVFDFDSPIYGDVSLQRERTNVSDEGDIKDYIKLLPVFIFAIVLFVLARVEINSREK